MKFFLGFCIFVLSGFSLFCEGAEFPAESMFQKYSKQAKSTINVPGDVETIQGAIDSATDGDEIVVATGEYPANLKMNGKNIILRSTDPLDSDIVESTILNGGGEPLDPYQPNISNRVIIFSGTETAKCVVAGFTITNGYITDYKGGAGIQGNGTLATIEHNIISDCFNPSLAGNGGGIQGCNGLIQFNLITGNSGGNGGGALSGCGGVIQFNEIVGNSAGISLSAPGGGLYACGGIIRYNTISNNKAAQYGGGLGACDNALILGNIIQDNTCENSYMSDYGYGGGIGLTRYAVIVNNLIFNNYASSSGGGLGSVGSSGSVIANNVIFGNKADKEGGGITASGPTCKIVNCIIWGELRSRIPSGHFL